MKTTITIISLTAILAGLTLLAQEPPRPAAGGGPAERFKQMDRNGDRESNKGVSRMARGEQNLPGPNPTPKPNAIK
jgi:hypothetical protein